MKMWNFGKFLIMFFGAFALLAVVALVIDICAAVYWSLDGENGRM